MDKAVYIFGGTGTDGDASMDDLLGGKGANLAEMSNLGMPVPLGITIPTSVCNEYAAFGDKDDFLTELVDTHVMPALYDIVNEVGYAPLWSVRSGAKFSMPGMMDTLLNIGITEESEPFWKDRLGECSFLDCKRRLIAMYGSTVEGCDPKPFAEDWKAKQSQKYGSKKAPGSEAAVLASPKHMQKTVRFHLKYFEKMAGKEFPSELRAQLKGSIGAVFESWNSERAIEYREMHGISHSLGTAVNIQMMVFGNMNENSLSGVAFTRDPATGHNVLMGEFVRNAQGEDVVAGTATPLPLSEMAKSDPELFGQLNEIAGKLEEHYLEMMDVEFTVEDGVLWMLQCRVGKRTGEAAFRIAYDMVEEGKISKKEAVSRVTAKQYAALKKIRIEGDVPKPDYEGIAAGGGLVKGHVVTTSEEAKKVGKEKAVILVTDETTPDDFGGMAASVGILTRTGGATSHAAVVGRSLEKSCVVGTTDLPDLAGFPAIITICGSTGRVWLKDLSLTQGQPPDFANTVFGWAVELNGGNVAVKQGIEAGLTKGSYVMLGDAKADHVEQFVMNSNPPEGPAFVDLQFSGENPLDEDDKLWGLLNAPGPDFGFKTEARVMVLAGLAAIGNVVIVPNAYTTAAHIKKLRKSGWKVCSRVTTIEELLESDGIVEVDPSFAKSIGGEKVAQKLYAMMEKAGQQIELRPNPVSQSRLVFEVLK